MPGDTAELVRLPVGSGPVMVAASSLLSVLRSRPRHAGAVPASAAVLWALSAWNLGGSNGVVVVGAWLLGIALGSHYRMLVDPRFFRATTTVPYSQSWRGVLVGGVGLGTLAALLFDGVGGLGPAADALSLGTSVFYGFAKLGCYLWGCCGWPASEARRRSLPSLQLLEVVSSVVLSVILAGLTARGSVLLPTAVFLGAHGVQRVASRAARHGGLGASLCTADSGLAFLLGGLILVLRR